MKRQGIGIFSGLSLLLVAIMLTIAHGASAASPVSGSNTTHRHVYMRPTINTTIQKSTRASNLVYHGGPVMNGTTQAYAIFWEPAGSKVSKNYNALILRYLSDIGGSPLYHNNIQYTDKQKRFPSNATLGGSWVDTKTAYPSTTLTDGDIQNEVTHALKSTGWTPSMHRLFIVFTALNVTDDAGTAYHSNFGNTIYAIVPDIFASWHVFPGNVRPNNDFDADSTILVTSHEQTEAATDPLGTAWYDNNGMEIGDKCEKYFGTQNADGSNVNWNGHPYIVQGEWDNAKHACTLVGP